MRQLSALFLTLLLGFKAHALDSIEDYIKEYPNQEPCQRPSASKTPKILLPQDQGKLTDSRTTWTIQ